MKLVAPEGPLVGEVELPVSKSLVNRYLIMAALAGQKLPLPDRLPMDVQVLKNALSTGTDQIDIGMSGTAMRFLTAFLAIQEGREVTLTGAERMKLRPIKELVEALRTLRAELEYLEKDGALPLRIHGQRLKGGAVEISGSVSSQFVSALMMIGPLMENGLQLNLKGKVLSMPYIQLTVDCMRKCRVEVSFCQDRISITRGSYRMSKVVVESDWTAASYFYVLAACRPGSELFLKGLNLDSPQGDRIIAQWFEKLGVSSDQKENGVAITSSGVGDFPAELDFSDNPDLAQTFAFLAAALGKKLKLTGLDNLRFKETDRVSAIQTELGKLGLKVVVDENSMTISDAISVKDIHVRTYNDHRMAMSAAELAIFRGVEIEDPEVVNKSFPTFWTALEGLGFLVI